jgi:redox-sensing transcriptional repressor
VTPEETPQVRDRAIPEATVGRLPVYLRALLEMAGSGVATISSGDLAGAAGVNSAKVRKDLSYLGSYGTRGVGYDVAYLIHQVRRELGLTQHWPVVIAGAGNLGHALTDYRGFAQRGFQVVALVDIAPEKIGRRAGPLVIDHIDRLGEIVRRDDVAIGVICTPAAAAQGVADRMVAAGIRSILNFAPAVLTVPPAVSVRKVDLSIELQILAYYEQRTAGPAEVEGRPAGEEPSGDGQGRATAAVRGSVLGRPGGAS